MEVKAIINYLEGNKGYGITISETEGDEKVLRDMCYKHNIDYNSIEITGYNEFEEMDKYIIKNDIVKVENDISNISVFTKDKEIIIENWE
ncbi:hypothetical protein [Clostridium sporogenes]|uniref:hypothetical protein n=1 Tax=Clostridium sporogenes TaxID=1509 RepID=UPI0013CF6E1F|nr:hypothetical protein [Clostridium sporogenes]NFF75883.1 hypothetical protein [Clostridium sporogenes]NFH40771.1 hypothetical protein [Clostridium sporogenes]